jgi:hypothetical protein
MSDTKKDKAKILRKTSRKQNKLPRAQVISPNKKEYKRTAVKDIEEYDEEAIYQEELYDSRK